MRKKFERLSLRERAIHLRQRGSAITRRRHNLYLITLCALDGEYVEMWYHIIDRRIEKIEIVTGANALEAYLGQISLSGVHEMLHNPETRDKYRAEANRRLQLREQSGYTSRVYQNPLMHPDPAAPQTFADATKDYILRKAPEYFKSIFRISARYLLLVFIYLVLLYGSLSFRDAFGGSQDFSSEGYDKYCRESMNRSSVNSGKENLNYLFSNVKVGGDSLR